MFIPTTIVVHDGTREFMDKGKNIRNQGIGSMETLNNRGGHN